MGKLFIKNVNIVDSVNGALLCKNVLIENDRIAEITGKTESSPQDAKIIDAEGKWLMPGLIDMHVHLCAETGVKRSGLGGNMWRSMTSPTLQILHAQNNAYKSLLAGFTTLRNCGHVSYLTPEDISLRDGIQKELIDGPTIVASAGEISMTGGHGDLLFQRNLRRLPEAGYGHPCYDGVWKCVEGVREKVRIGADFIKIMASGGMGSSGDEPEWPNYQVEELKAIVAESHDLYKKVAAHAQGKLAIERCVEAGIDTIEHGCFLDDRLCNKMAEKGLFYVPTLRVVKILTESGEPEEKKKAQKLVDVHLAAITAARKEGVKIAYGTDTINALKHGENALEILNMLEAGMTGEEVFKAVTYTSAEALGMNDKIGAVQKNMYADLIIVNANPLDDMKALANTDNIAAVIKHGKVIKEALNNNSGALPQPH